MISKGRLAVLLAVAAVAAGCGSAPAMNPRPSPEVTRCVLPAFGPGSAYHPAPGPLNANVTNRAFPLHPGWSYRYTGVKDGQKAVDVVTVAGTTVIGGTTARVVLDRLYLDGKLAEKTSDFFAQDQCGNVWYVGEDTVAADDQGNLTDRSGSFRAGTGGAQPGVFMPANLRDQSWYRQEWLAGQAQDEFRITGMAGGVVSVTERSALEPGILAHKTYRVGVGVVSEAEPGESLTLTGVTR